MTEAAEDREAGAATEFEGKASDANAGGESSGLSDIRQVAAAVFESHEIQLTPEDDEDDFLPAARSGFGATAAASLVAAAPAAPLVPAATAATAATVVTSPAPARSKATPILIGTAGVLLVTALGLAFAFATGGDEPKIADASRAPAPTMGGGVAAAEDAAPKKAADDDKAQPDEEPADEPAAAGSALAGDDPDAADDDAQGDSPEAASTGGDRATRSPKRTGARSSRNPDKAAQPSSDQPKSPKSGDAEPKAEPEPKEKPTNSEHYTVDCLLNPELPQCRDARPKGDDKQDADDPRAGLPDKLTTDEVRVGFNAIKAAAKACGPMHSVPSGTKIRVKVSISGETGKVLTAKTIGEHADAPVGKCVSEALRHAQFGQFRKAVMGVTYPVTL